MLDLKIGQSKNSYVFPNSFLFSDIKNLLNTMIKPPLSTSLLTKRMISFLDILFSLKR